MKKLILLPILIMVLAGCKQGLTILDGATHARGSAHVEGYLTDSEADLDLCKVPKDYTVEQAVAYCQPVN